LSISRINPPKIGGGLKFEPNAEIEQKGAFCKGIDLDPAYGGIKFSRHYDYG
jgi:hypothetical protein